MGERRADAAGEFEKGPSMDSDAGLSCWLPVTEREASKGERPREGRTDGTW